MSNQGQEFGRLLLRIGELEDELANVRAKPAAVRSVRITPATSMTPLEIPVFAPREKPTPRKRDTRGVCARIREVLARHRRGLSMLELRRALPEFADSVVTANVCAMKQQGYLRATGERWHRVYRLPDA